jgi:SAM-dependent methyltransferase
MRWNGYVRSRFAARPGPVDRAIGLVSQVAGLDNEHIDSIYRFAPKAPARILDYGCGGGDYLLKMQPFGYELQGAEFDPHLLTELSGRGIAVADVARLNERDWAGEFDHITLSHVLEHVPDPVDLLARLFGWLKPGGTLYVEVPHADATGLTIFGPVWRGLEAPRHFALPSRQALIDAFEKSGFGIERQHISVTARPLVWDASIEAVPEPDKASAQALIDAAPPETLENAEFLTFVARKPV